MNTISKKKIKSPIIRKFVLNNYKCDSPVIEKYILGALIKCRDKLYDPKYGPQKSDMETKEKEYNFKANLILNEIMNKQNAFYPKELQYLNCTVFFITKGGGYQFWGNFKYYISASFGDDTVLILLN